MVLYTCHPFLGDFPTYFSHQLSDNLGWLATRSLVHDVDQFRKLGRLLDFQCSKASINGVSSHGKWSQFQCYSKKKRKRKKWKNFNQKILVTWVIITFLLWAQVGFIRSLSKILLTCTCWYRRLATRAYTTSGASMSGTQLLENFNYLPTKYLIFKYIYSITRCNIHDGREYSPKFK